jgi:hypothetical protein
MSMFDQTGGDMKNHGPAQHGALKTSCSVHRRGRSKITSSILFTKMETMSGYRLLWTLLHHYDDIRSLLQQPNGDHNPFPREP